jgi:hypothetical protein
MKTHPPTQHHLTGLDGTNPLGFLAALGTLVTVHGAGERGVRLRWQRGVTWMPVIEGASARDADELSEIVARGLRGREVAPEAEQQRTIAAKEADAAKKALVSKEKEVRKRKLKGNARKEALEAEVDPLRSEYERLRGAWLAILAAAVPRAELALGKRIDCTGEEYRQHAVTLTEGARCDERSSVDLLAAFGTDACLTEKGDTIAPTWFQFITGGGHQFFLKTVRDLIGEITPERVRDTLFNAWTYPDEGLSMRWDPAEDRRYALMDRDPTASNNKPRTMWMANLLGYRALELFPTAPRRRGPAVVAWTMHGGQPAFTWPLWEFAASADTVRSLLALPFEDADRASVRARGISMVLRARRIKVGSGANYKLNFSPARAVM